MLPRAGRISLAAAAAALPLSLTAFGGTASASAHPAHVAVAGHPAQGASTVHVSNSAPPPGARPALAPRAERSGAGPVSDHSDRTRRQAIGCTPKTYAHNPHYSNGDASAHGQWDKGNCSNNTAHVTVGLYEYYTDGYFYRKAVSTKKLKPKKVSNNSTVARATCDSRARDITWMNVVDVDVDGEIDSAERGTNKQDFSCVVN